ncbi:nitric oxide dioxygenase [Pseudogulbenkiania sp. NH8B]|uniref:NO-inducible flavohemoprotein n=1 Tax=Pseudogulbenkiania sp. (strain NH8B) TaxID=748280 RepID=UPI000227972B|nr:NO-inducible flavohemoprotein [Pseudogulbenkiania sp. NH8B]BAK75547.1 nitric oxide dioxygenase [Pseudogulbenkiania sp. NH8B]
MLSSQHRELVKATVPVLREHGVALTSHFYRRMFSHNPELKHVFNQAKQEAGQQQQALALAVLGYAEHIDDPSVLAPVVMRIAHKHVGLGIRAEHYPIVGHHLLSSISEVLGEAASDELLEAWRLAYGQLADLLIGAEQQLYTDGALSRGGWSGVRSFTVTRKVAESSEITSFYLSPSDKGAVPGFRPGQYITLKRFVPELGLLQPRQYSLSDAPGQDYLRISVKREPGNGSTPAGRISNLLHDTVHEGDQLELAPPGGDFFLHEERSTPVVLISGGVGVTPMIAMLNHLVLTRSPRRVAFVHGCRNGAVHAMKRHVNQLAAECDNVSKVVFYEEVGAEDRLGEDYDQQGRVDLGAVREQVLLPDADYYLCGPLAFMLAQRDWLLAAGVDGGRIHYEVFGSHTIAG